MRRTFRTKDRKEHAELGRIIRELREAAPLTQREFAAKLDRTQAFVWKVENGTQAVDVATLIDIAKALGTTASSMLAQIESQ